MGAPERTTFTFRFDQDVAALLGLEAMKALQGQTVPVRWDEGSAEAEVRRIDLTAEGVEVTLAIEGRLPELARHAGFARGVLPGLVSPLGRKVLPST